MDSLANVDTPVPSTPPLLFTHDALMLKWFDPLPLSSVFERGAMSGEFVFTCTR
jgi:hypothetical protein